MLHVGVGLRPGQESCATAHALGAGSAPPLPSDTCCVNGAAGDRLSRTQIAVLRNPNNQKTTIEVAIAMRDLLPESAMHAVHPGQSAGAVQSALWKQGLKFGFAFALNDVDDPLLADSADSEGWLGYYPHAIKVGDAHNVPGETPGAWNDGQREPSKAGVIELGGMYTPPAAACALSGGGGGGGAGLFFLGVFLTLLLQVIASACFCSLSCLLMIESGCLWLLHRRLPDVPAGTWQGLGLLTYRAREDGVWPFTHGAPLHRLAKPRRGVLAAGMTVENPQANSMSIPLASSDACTPSTGSLSVPMPTQQSVA